MTEVAQPRMLLRRSLAIAGPTAAALVVLWWGLAQLGVGSDGTADVLERFGLPIVAVAAATAVALRAILVATDRPAWGVLACGLAAYAPATVYWAIEQEFRHSTPAPSLTHVGALLLYPAALIALVLLIRRPARRLRSTLWLDAAIAATTTAAFAFSSFRDVVERIGETASTATALTTAAYPAGDLLLLVVVTGAAALTGWRPGNTWTLLGAGFVAFALADTVYLHESAGTELVDHSTLDALWALALLLVAGAAWQPRADRVAEPDAPRLLAVPGTFVAVALVLLVWDHYSPLDDVSVLLAAATLALSMVRTAVAFVELRALADTRRQALTDDLTELPNRRAFNRRLNQLVTDPQRGAGLLMIDLDRFKELNDTLGHAAGDELLSLLGARLRTAVRGQDTLARLGGDEFGVLVPDGDLEVALGVAGRIASAVAHPFTLEGIQVHVGASIGVALYPTHATTAAQLMQRADIAMYAAKSTRSGIEIYARGDGDPTPDRLVLAAELRNALGRGELRVHYQPQADPVTGAIHGLEALVRWQHPRLGVLSADAFLPAAQREGLMRPITAYVLETALAQLRRWLDAGHDLTLAVNLSVSDVLDSELPHSVARLLERWGVPPARLRFEITENTTMAGRAGLTALLHELDALGVGLSLDDFGTGHASLAQLKELPIGELKIDRDFVTGMVGDRVNAAIVRSTVELARQLGIAVVAEGVEDDETRRALAALGCTSIQGYAISPPVSASEITALLPARAPAF